MKAMLIFNPAAGAREVERELEQVVAYWEGRGWQVSFRETQGAGDATTFAREAVATSCQAVFVAGGDGTVSEVADGLAGSDVALGVLPAGVGNVWALEMGIPTPSPLRRHPLLDAAEVLVEGEIRRIDLGRAGPVSTLSLGPCTCCPGQVQSTKGWTLSWTLCPWARGPRAGQYRTKYRVVVLAGVQQELLELLRVLRHLPHDGSDFHEVGAGTDDVEDFHRHELHQHPLPRIARIFTNFFLFATNFHSSHNPCYMAHSRACHPIYVLYGVITA